MTVKELYLLVIEGRTPLPVNAKSIYEDAVTLTRELTQACHYEWWLMPTRALAKFQIEAFGIGAICGAGALLVAKKVHDARIKRK